MTTGSPSRPLLLASLIAVVMSCGGIAPEPASPEASTGAGLRLPTPMPLIKGDLASKLRAHFEAPVSEPIAIPTSSSTIVSFRLGPKLATRSFEIGFDGSMDKADLKKLRGMFRCRRSQRTHRINKGLLAKIADLSEHYQGHTIEIVSAYRHGKNASRKSRHRHGRAIDIKVVGIPAAQVRDYVWARYDQDVGVGFYKQQQFVHLDHRKNYPATAWTQKHHSAQNEYKPRWSRPSRRDRLVVALAGSPAAQ